jgi:hypothetical protein
MGAPRDASAAKEDAGGEVMFWLIVNATGRFLCRRLGLHPWQADWKDPFGLMCVYCLKRRAPEGK